MQRQQVGLPGGAQHENDRRRPEERLATEDIDVNDFIPSATLPHGAGHIQNPRDLRVLRRCGADAPTRSAESFHEILADSAAGAGTGEEVADEEQFRIRCSGHHGTRGANRLARLGPTGSGTGEAVTRRLGSRSLTPETPNAKDVADRRMPSTAMKRRL